MKFVAIIIPLVEFDIYSLDLEYVIWSYNNWDLQLKDLRGNFDRL